MPPKPNRNITNAIGIAAVVCSASGVLLGIVIATQQARAIVVDKTAVIESAHRDLRERVSVLESRVKSLETSKSN